MKKFGLLNRIIFTVFLSILFSLSAGASDFILTGVVDGPYTGGLPKEVELYVVNNIPDTG